MFLIGMERLKKKYWCKSHSLVPLSKFDISDNLFWKETKNAARSHTRFEAKDPEFATLSIHKNDVSNKAFNNLL